METHAHRPFVLLLLLAGLSACGKDAPSDSAALTDNDGDAVLSSVDCNDEDATIYPGADETCDSVDQDCDGDIDEEAIDTTEWYVDADSDGYGGEDVVRACSQPADAVDASGDCDDDDDERSPDVAEVCDDIDQDCDDLVDEDFDQDGDGWRTCDGDCDDGDASAWPGAEEIPYDGTDNDCAGDGDLTDVDGDGYDSEEVGGDDCDDNNAAVKPGALDTWDGVDNDCDGEADRGYAEYLSIGDTDARFVGKAAGDRIGRYVSWAGDVNGDEIQDIVIGGILTGTGVAYVVTGPVNGEFDLADAEVELLGEGDGDQSGIAVSGRNGDVNGDGYDDILVGSYKSTSYVVMGGPPMFGKTSLGEADVKLVGEAEDDQVGRAVSAGGDMNDDGYADLLVGAPGHDYDREFQGAVYMTLGAADLDATVDLSTTDVKFIGESSGDALGHAVAWAGDVDGDGLDDIVMGAYSNDAAFDEAGAVYVFHGGDGLSGLISAADADTKITGEAEGDKIGRMAVANAGDVDGDGRDDLLMGATLSDHNGEASGTAYLVSGMVTGERSASLSQARFFGEASEDSAGRSLAGVGDINGDGFADISIASPHADIGELSEGAMYLVLGPVGGTNNLADADYKLGGEYVQDFLGWAMSGGEGFDINDDGFPDMLIGAYLGDSNGTNSGSAYMVLGGAW